MVNDYVFPRLAHDDIFENIVCDILANDFRNPNIQRYGRKGQSQKGLDIVGIAGKDYVNNELIGAQCKNHIISISDDKLQKEVLSELKKFEKNKLPIQRFLFITSAENSAPVKDFVTKLSLERVSKGLCPVDILFWDFIVGRLSVYDDILFKYFTHLLPTAKSEQLTIPDLNKKTKVTFSLSSSNLIKEKNEILQSKLSEVITQNISGIQQGGLYNLYLGISTKKNISFDGYVDLNINFSELFEDEDNLSQKFSLMKDALKKIIEIISYNSFSKELVIYTDIEISLAFLLGRILRKHKFEVKIIFKNQIWTTSQENLLYVPAVIDEDLPQINDSANNEGVFIFDATKRKSARNDIDTYLTSFPLRPHIIVSYEIGDNQIQNSAHALSVAKNIVEKIHRLESWNIRKIHLFILTPKPLAFLIGYLLNTLNSNISLYFMDGSRSKYLVSGVVDNNTF